MSRTKASFKNFIWNNVRTLALTVLRFIARTIFIKTLGATYLGAEGLFTNILGFLSLAELGIGSAISFSLYKPLADNDIPKIQALINFFRKAYRYVAGSVLVLGIALVPFIPKIAKGAENIEHLQLIFCVYLFNTVSSYLLTYKATIISADQKYYLYSNILLITNIVTVILQCMSLFLFKNFLIYIVIASITGFCSNVFANYYTGKLYPYIRKRNDERLSKEESKTLFGKIKALLYHKIGQVVISQTDSIITSSIINVTMVGLVSNYNMVINVIKSITVSLFNVMIPSLGNLIASKDLDYQKRVYKNIEFLSFWINSFTTVSLFFLMTPFVKIWLGNDYIFGDSLVFLLVINYYIYISRLPIFSLRSAAGVFEPDRISPVIESVINLVVSIVLAKKIGIVGVYIGTLVSSFVPYIWCPIVVYKHVFKDDVKKYFLRQFVRLAEVMAYSCGMYFLFQKLSFDNLILNLVFRGGVCLVIPNLFIIVFYAKTEEFKYIIRVAKNILRGFLKR